MFTKVHDYYEFRNMLPSSSGLKSNLEDEGSNFIRNVGIQLQDCTAQGPTKQLS
jgi:hypothetical protein